MGRASRRRADFRASKVAGDPHVRVLDELHSVVGITVAPATLAQRYEGDPEKSPRGIFKRQKVERRPRGYSEREIAEFQGLSLRIAKRGVTEEQHRMIRSLVNQGLSPAEGTAALRAMFGDI